jgi:2-polyprenyl-3-methyl-5-hydroxy-6-metoxy-1,4-benzoquinol methylase
MNNYLYIKEALVRMKKINRDFKKGSLDEQAIPAYLDGNHLSRLAFVSRLIAVMKLVDLLPRKNSCIDFGCGSGVMLPWLKVHFDNVTGVDIELEFATRFVENIFVKLVNNLSVLEIPPESQDLILALDVLEHMKNPGDAIQKLSSLLNPKGVLIISGPTENRLYKLGRKIVGFEGHYHHTDIHRIQTTAEEFLFLKKRIKILPIATLFEILCFVKNDFNYSR